MGGLGAPLSKGLLRRFNFRLHPLLAAGIGLGIVALLVPSRGLEEERHSAEEILARLSSKELDLEHAPPFWLRELKAGSALWRQALDLCSLPDHASRPNCRVVLALARLAAEPPAGEAKEP